MINQISTNLFHTNRSILKANKDAAILGEENMKGKRSVENQNAADIISLGINYSAKSTFDGIIYSMEHGLEYLSPIQSSLLEMQRLYQAGLDIATQAATNPNMRGPQATAVNQELRSIIDDAQRTVKTTRDSSGKTILDGTLLLHHEKALSNIRLIMQNDDVMQAGDASVANNHLQSINELGLSDNTKRLLDKIASEALKKQNKVEGTIDYLIEAMKVIPNIKVDTSQMRVYHQDAIRANKIGSMLQEAIKCALEATNHYITLDPNLSPIDKINTAQRLIKANIISALINETVSSPDGIDADACDTAPDNAQAIKNLLTQGEIQSLKNYIKTATPSKALNIKIESDSISAIHNQELSEILRNISCFRNIEDLISTQETKNLYGNSEISAGISVNEAKDIMRDMLGDFLGETPFSHNSCNIGRATSVDNAARKLTNITVLAICKKDNIRNMGTGAVVNTILRTMIILGEGIDAYNLRGGAFNPHILRQDCLAALNNHLPATEHQAGLNAAINALLENDRELKIVALKGEAANQNNVDINNIMGAGAIKTMTSYVADIVAQKVQNAKPYEVRIGTSENDKLSLSINDISPAAVGIEEVNVLSEGNALDAVESLKLAVQKVSNALISLSNQSKHLKSQLEVVNSSRDVILETIANIQNVDPVVNAKELSRLHNTTKSAGFTIGLEQAFENSLQETANSILRRAVAASA